MWNLNLERIEHLLPKHSRLGGLAVETGTCRGNGTKGLARKFSKVITIELSEALHRTAKSSLAGEFPHIDFVQGNSSEQLARILPSLPADEPIFFFLDAHWSGDRWVDWVNSPWKGYGVDTAHLGILGSVPASPEQCPLPEELAAIVKHCRGQAFVLIDDTKNIPSAGPGLKNSTFSGEDWSHVSRSGLFEIVSPRLEKFHEFSDPAQWFLAIHPMHPGVCKRIFP